MAKQNKIFVSNEERNFIEELHEKLLDNMGIILIRNVSKKRKSIIHEIASEYGDMAAFTVNDPITYETHMVLRYKSPIYSTPFNMEDSFRSGNAAYLNEDYESCIDIYLNALQYGKSNNLSYAIIGFALAKLGRYSEALDYLTVANCLMHSKNYGIDFTETIVMLEKNTHINTNTIQSTSDKDIDLQLLRDRYSDVILNGNIQVIDNLDAQRINRLQMLLNLFPGMSGFVVGEETNPSLVLKENMPIFIKAVDTAEITNVAESAYLIGNYDEAISESLKLAKIIKPISFNFSRIGLAYSKKKEYKKAIFYLEIARGLSIREKEQLTLGFDELINDLKIAQQHEESNAKATTPLYNEVDTSYVINYFDEICSTISESNLDFSDACKAMNIDGEQLDILRILCAKKAYLEGNTRTGDAFLKAVQDKEDKSTFTEELVSDISSNKKMYQSIKKLSFDY